MIIIIIGLLIVLFTTSYLLTMFTEKDFIKNLSPNIINDDIQLSSLVYFFWVLCPDDYGKFYIWFLSFNTIDQLFLMASAILTQFISFIVIFYFYIYCIRALGYIISYFNNIEYIQDLLYKLDLKYLNKYPLYNYFRYYTK